jgi:predicted nucleotidyltransferase
MDHRSFSRKGGKARSPIKTAANRAKAVTYWNAVRAGVLPGPRRPRVPPAPDAIGKMLAEYCQRNDVIQLEAFGSTARGEAKRGSDVDLMASFSHSPGLHFFTMEAEMSELLGVPVHLLTRDSVEEMSNPYRRNSILADAKVVYHA